MAATRLGAWAVPRRAPAHLRRTVIRAGRPGPARDLPAVARRPRPDHRADHAPAGQRTPRRPHLRAAPRQGDPAWDARAADRGRWPVPGTLPPAGERLRRLTPSGLGLQLVDQLGRVTLRQPLGHLLTGLTGQRLQI